MNFDDVAREWDNKRRIERAEIISNKIKETISNRRNRTAMEFGCGTGLISFNLADLFKSITLIDTSQEMINIVNKKIEKLSLKNINSYCYDLVKDSLNEDFDMIYSSMVLHHIIDISNLFKKFYSMIKLNGTLCIVDLNEDDGRFHKNQVDFNGHNGFSQEYMINILKDIGFCNIRSETFYQGTKQIDDENISYSLFIMIANK